MSTIKELARRWNPDLLAMAPPKALGHRALEDIRESIVELRYYRQSMFVEKAEVPDADAPGSSDKEE